jgi:hypothetical protein
MLSFLGSEIGRGHPFYLDGVLRALGKSGRAGLIARRADVFSVSSGFSRLAWRAVRAAYTVAGRGGPIADAYHRLRGRTSYDDDSLLLSVLGRDLRRWAGRDGVVVVDHPAVVGALGGRADVWYVHGEMVAPREAIVRRAARILVPLEDTAGEFMRGGIHPERLPVTGVCVENELLPGAYDAMEARRARIAGDGALTVAFFSSGAEPPPHVATLATGAAALAADGPHRPVVFARRGGRLEAAARRAGAAAGSGEIVTFGPREELDRLTAERFAGIDVVASPPHERSNWAVALGTPFLLVGPDIGPFAPRNRDLLLRRGVAVELPADAARDLPRWIDRQRADGHLKRMSEMAGGVPFRGFERIADLLAEEVERRGWGG